jgi:hypothetical protein
MRRSEEEITKNTTLNKENLCNSWQGSGVAGKSSIHLDSPQALAKLASACKTDL